MTTPTSSPSHHDDRPRRTARGRGEAPALAVACTATVLVIGLVAAINLAVPLLGASPLHPDAAQLLWIVDAYVIVFACLVVPGGAIGDRFGRKGTLMTGLIVFAVGAIITAVAPDILTFLSGRVITGLGAALVLPNSVGIVVHATAPERRARALAVWGAVSGLGGLAGNVGGGALLSLGHWQLLFWTIAPLALACALWIAVGVRRSARTPRPLDAAGTVLIVAATVTLLTGIIEGPEKGWTGPLVLGSFALSTVLWTAWVVVALRTAHPLLDPRLLRLPQLAAACLGMIVLFFGSFGLFYVNASALQYGRDFTTLETGLAILPMVLPLALGARAAPRLAARLGLLTSLAIAFACISAGLVGLASATSAPYPIYALWLLVVGCGFALGLPTLTVELTSALPVAQAGLGGGLQSATRELGSALGVAIVGTILTTVFAAALPASAHGRRTIAAALQAAPADHASIVNAFVSGADVALRVAGATTALLGALVVLAIWRATRRGAADEGMKR